MRKFINQKLDHRDLGIKRRERAESLYTFWMGKLVKKTELIALGTFGIMFFSYTHFSAILSVLNASSTPASYTASAAAAYPDTRVPEVVDLTVTAPENSEATYIQVSSSTEVASTTETGSAVQNSENTSAQDVPAVDPQ